MGTGKLNNKKLIKLQSVVGRPIIVGVMTTDYIEFICARCGKYVDMTYRGGDPVIPYFTYSCECGNKGQFKINEHRVHNLPIVLKRKK